MTSFIQSCIDFLSLGSLYALIALGLALVFGIMRFINFAHGELLMGTGYALFFVSGKPFIVMVAVALLSSVALALLMERAAFRPIRGASVSTQLVASFAISFLLQSIVSVAFGAQAKSVALPSFFSGQVSVAGFRIPNLDLITALVAAVLITGLALFLRGTRMGVQIRAAAEDFEMARLMGIRANTVIAAAFGISGLLAGAAGIMLVANSGTVVPTMGLNPVVIGFVAIIVGGLGSLPGAAVGAYLLSFLTVLLQSVLPFGLRQFRDAFVFAAVIGVFLVRPGGLVSSKRMKTRV